MIKAILLSGLFSASLFLHGCKTADVETLQTQNEPTIAETKPDNFSNANIAEQKIEKTNSTSQKVNFKGVSFTYNPQIFGAVKMEEVAEYALQDETFKPDGVEPQHRLFTFDLSNDYSPMEISVYPINDFPRMYAVNKLSVKAMEAEIENFKKVLKDKNFRTYDNEIPNLHEIPYLPFRDASQTFQAKVKYLNFPGGKGILFLTFWETQIELPSNRQLFYIFEGLTNDGKYYVLAEMPVSVDFLPKDSSDEYEGYKIPSGKEFNEKVVFKKMTEVDKKVAERLENLPENKLKPNPKYFEQLISSLKIEQ